MIDTSLDHEYRLRAVHLLESVVPADRSSDSAGLVCQGRQLARGYSGCADLAHYMYEALGLKSRQINRAPAWRCGQNVSLLAGWSVARRPEPELLGVDGGDVLIRWSQIDTRDAHVVCVLAHCGDTLSTAEYGQTPPQIGRLCARRVSGEGRPWRLWLPLPAVLRACSQSGY